MQTLIADQSQISQTQRRLSEVAILSVFVGLHHVGVADADLEVDGVCYGVVQRLPTSRIRWRGRVVERLAHAYLTQLSCLPGNSGPTRTDVDLPSSSTVPFGPASDSRVRAAW